MKIIIFTCLSYLLFSTTWGQKAFSLQLDTKALILLDETEFRITGENSAELIEKLSIQINNDDGREYSKHGFYENSYIKLENIEASIRDLNGDLIRELDEDDIHHSSITRDISDGTNYWFNLYSPKYPYIFECVIEYEINTLFWWPGWSPEASIPVIESKYRLIQEEYVPFKTYSIGIDVGPEISVSGSDTIYTWQMQNIPAKTKKYRTPPELSNEKFLLLNSINFNVDGYPGNIESWDNFADWIRKLYKDKYNLSPKAVDEVKALTAKCQNDYEKIQLIYTFLQEQTRYVAIELGLGRWQPYSADWVYNNKFGDCKDLSVCLISMLDAVNIKAYPALMKTRDAGIVYPEFPANQFNHVLVFVELEKDTIWLEATADFLKVGELPTSRQGCNVLVVKKNKGEIIRTPVSTSRENLENSRIEGMVNSWSGLKFEGKICYTGQDKSNIYQLYRMKDKQKIEKVIQNYLGRFESAPEIDNYEFTDFQDEVTLSLSGQFKNFANQSNKRIFLNPNILNRIDFNEELKNEEREFPVYFSYPYIEIDTVIVTIPFAKNLESAPRAVDMDSSFGRYKISHEFSDKTLTYIRHFEIKQRLIPSASYESYVNFMLNVEKSDRKRFVFTKF